MNTINKAAGYEEGPVAPGPSLADFEFNRRFHEDLPLRPIPPGRDIFAERWRSSREFLFGLWIDIDAEVAPSDFTRALDDMFWQADEMIIPLVDYFEREGAKVARPKFELALTKGIDSVKDAPREFIEFLDALVTPPSWFDAEAAERGRLLMCAATLPAVRMSLGFGLIETAMTTDISSTTGATGRFKVDPIRRYAETLRMFALSAKPDIFKPTSIVFQTMVRVRLMHALASRGLRKAWGDDHYLRYGEPIAATSLLGFGNGPLLLRLVDHRLGRRLSASDLDDLAMFASWFSHVMGAPHRLLARNGNELIRTMNYIYARGGEPSGWREEFVRSVRTPFDALSATYLPWLPKPVRNALTVAGCKAVSMFFVSPQVPIFGINVVDEFVSGVDEFTMPFELHSSIFFRYAKLNARLAAIRDRIPGMVVMGHRINREGPPGIDWVANGMSTFARHYHGIALSYTHHDGSTRGRGFGPPRTD